MLMLSPSKHLETLPEVESGYAKIVTPQSYANWPAAKAANPTTRHWLLTSGSYLHWGDNTISDSGSPNARKSIRYYHPDSRVMAMHPEKRKVRGEEAVVGVINFTAPGGVRQAHWYFHGLTGRGYQGQMSTGSVGKATYVTWDYCLLEDNDGYGVRLFSSNNCVQRCLIRGTARSPDDAPAVQLFSNNTENLTGIKLLDNELCDYGDQIAFSDSGIEVFYDDILIEGNDGYSSGARYNPGGLSHVLENCVDIKIGSSRPEGVVFRSNRWWGTRRTLRNGIATSDGTGFVIHRYARNILVEGDIFDDMPNGIWTNAYAGDTGIPSSTPRNVRVRNCAFSRVRNISGVDNGACSRSNGTDIFENCYFSRSDYVAFANTTYIPGPPSFAGCVRGEETGVFHPSSVGAANPYVAAQNRVIPATTRYRPYQRKRWSGPEIALSAIPIDTRDPNYQAHNTRLAGMSFPEL